MVIRGVCGIVVAFYLALILVVPSRLTWTMTTIFLVVVPARRFADSAVADHAYSPTSVCVIVATLAKFRVQTDAPINDRIPAMLEGVDVFVAVAAKPPVFSGCISASGG